MTTSQSSIFRALLPPKGFSYDVECADGPLPVGTRVVYEGRFGRTIQTEPGLGLTLLTMDDGDLEDACWHHLVDWDSHLDDQMPAAGESTTQDGAYDPADVDRMLHDYLAEVRSGFGTGTPSSLEEHRARAALRVAYALSDADADPAMIDHAHAHLSKAGLNPAAITPEKLPNVRADRLTFHRARQLVGYFLGLAQSAGTDAQEEAGFSPLDQEFGVYSEAAFRLHRGVDRTDRDPVAEVRAKTHMLVRVSSPEDILKAFDG